MQGLAENIAVKLIVYYQRYLSPRKGYRCAHSIYHGRSSCSTWAIRVIKKHGILSFIPLMYRRFIACAEAHEKLKDEDKKYDEVNSEFPCTKGEIASCCIHFLPIYK